MVDKIDGCEEDMKVKNAMYVEKNIELNQEFFFAHPATKLRINNIYNTHFSSSPLWNLFGPGAGHIETSYNRSVKIMLDLPYATHRCFIEPLTGEKHIKRILASRFLGFIENIEKCGKKTVKMLMETAKQDVRSVTGSNFRNIMLLVGKTSITTVKKDDADKIKYFPIEEDDCWKVDAIKELIDVKNSILEVPGFEINELNEILSHLCTS